MARASRFVLAGLVPVALVVLIWHRQLSYGAHVLARHGGTYWVDVAPDSQHLSPSMRLALADAPAALPGAFDWQSLAPGFEIGDLPVSAADHVVDHILLARIDPARFRFVLRNAPDGSRNLDDWMAQLGAALVVNGSYYDRTGEPNTPVLSDGAPLGWSLGDTIHNSSSTGALTQCELIAVSNGWSELCIVSPRLPHVLCPRDSRVMYCVPETPCPRGPDVFTR